MYVRREEGCVRRREGCVRRGEGVEVCVCEEGEGGGLYVCV